MNDEPQSFIDYWDEIDTELTRLFGIDTWTAGIEAELIASAQEDNQSPEEFARWFGEKHGLTPSSKITSPYGVPMAAKIARLNDLARKAMGVTCRLVQTAGICALPDSDQSAIREKVEMFRAFSKDNNPHGERDFGAFDHAGEKIFWKIDYYDTTISKGSEDPADPKQTTRVLTIMLASEY